MAIASVNPSTGETLQTFAELGETEIEIKLSAAQSAFARHRHTSFSSRAEKMRRAADILETDAEKFARIMAMEMGKPIRQGRAESHKCATCCRFYADNAESFLADENIATDAAQSFVRHDPIGIVLAIMPWNFPFWQVIRFAAPALMAGNAGLLKHSSNVPQCALALEQIFLRAGFDEGVFQTLLIGSEKVEKVLADPRVKAATLTGSEPAGRMVAASAGKLLKKTVLELGGSDPFIVMPSADLAHAARTAAKARCINSGQSCIAAKRFIVHEKVCAEFEELFASELRALRVGDPLDEATDIGPLATAKILEELCAQVDETVAAGARVVTGGNRIERPGNFFEPTLLAAIPKNSPGYREELFGPVALLFQVSHIDEAIALANDTAFGLGASAWTDDAEERARFIGELEAGMVYINAMVASDPRLPFGGVKNSGYGRELSRDGIREFMNIKSVWVENADAPARR